MVGPQSMSVFSEDCFIFQDNEKLVYALSGAPVIKLPCSTGFLIHDDVLSSECSEYITKEGKSLYTFHRTANELMLFFTRRKFISSGGKCILQQQRMRAFFPSLACEEAFFVAVFFSHFLSPRVFDGDKHSTTRFFSFSAQQSFFFL